MIRSLVWLPLLAAGLAVIAPAGEKQEKRVQVKKETSATPRDVGGDKVTPQEFITQAIDCSVSETDMAKKAAAGAATEEVKKFARQVAKDHEKLTRRLMDSAKDMKLGIVTGMSPEHKKAMAKMLLSRGNEYDRAFLSYFIQSHEKAVKLFERYVRAKDDDAKLRQLAEDTLPALRQHLKEARALQTMMFGDKKEKR